MDLTVVIPAFDEAESIGPVLERLCDHLQSIEELRGSFEVLVVDDGSTDGTGDIARRASSLVTLLRHPYNLGNGAASGAVENMNLMLGFDRLRGIDPVYRTT